MIDIEKIKAAALAATQGEWGTKYSLHYSNCHVISNKGVGRGICLAQQDKDATYIAAANPSVVLELIEGLRTAEEDRDEFQKVITAIGNAAKGYDFSGGLANYVAAMQEKLESAEKDAARYRWLRINNIVANIKFNFIADSYYVYGEALDIEIDAAMKESEK